MAMNHGTRNCSRMVQKALVELDLLTSDDIDGIAGPKTFNAMHSADEDNFLEHLLSVRERFYYKIVENKPSQKVFLRGWLNRVKSLRTVLETF